jgi:hypothetical protein
MKAASNAFAETAALVLRKWAELANGIRPYTAQPGTATDVLHLRAELGSKLSPRQLLSTASWDSARRMAAAAQLAFAANAEKVQSLLARSTEKLEPLADPLTTDFGLHRWLAGKREEAYSDWLQWVLQQTQTPSEVFRLLGVDPPEELQGWDAAAPTVGRELPVPAGHEGREGRLDLWVRCAGKALFVLEVKKGGADEADTQKQAGYMTWLDAQLEQYKYPILIAADAEKDAYEGFRFLRWSELCIGLRRLARRRAYEKQVVVAAMTLALTGAIEQNLLGLSSAGPGGLAGLNVLRLTAHLERWLAEETNDDGH